MTDTTTRPAATTTDRSALFSALIGLASLAVFFQSVWAGMMIREAKDYNQTWVNVHDWGARAAFVLALLATIVAVVKLRSRKDLLGGAATLTVLILAEAWLGGRIGGAPGVVAFHIPLAFAIFALAVWLPLRSRRG